VRYYEAKLVFYRSRGLRGLCSERQICYRGEEEEKEEKENQADT
jgi:hypothetical protein